MLVHGLECGLLLVSDLALHHRYSVDWSICLLLSDGNSGGWNRGTSGCMGPYSVVVLSGNMTRSIRTRGQGYGVAHNVVFNDDTVH